MKLDISHQEAFDIALNGVLRQGRRSYDACSGECMYDDGLGARCAVGHVVAAKFPDVKLNEGVSAVCAFREAGIEVKEFMLDNLISLQSIHDAEMYFSDEDQCVDEDYIKHFRVEMREYAENHGLEYKEA